jgi:hypothetical protein
VLNSSADRRVTAGGAEPPCSGRKNIKNGCVVRRQTPHFSFPDDTLSASSQVCQTRFATCQVMAVSFGRVLVRV